MNINMKNSLFLSVAAALSIMSTGCADATETPAGGRFVYGRRCC